MPEDDSSSGFGSPYQAVLDHCESAGLKFRADRDAKAVFFGIRGEAALYEVVLLVTQSDSVLQISVTLPVASKDPKLSPLLAEFATRASHRLVIGRFDYDMDEGWMRYNVGHAIGSSGLDEEMIGRLLVTVYATVDRYFPALMRVMFGGHTPADAVYLAELDCHDAAEEEEPSSPPQPLPPVKAKAPAKKKPRRPRKDPRSKTTNELPGLFDPPAGEGTAP